MARFYAPDRADFVTDFVFTPNWELATKILEKKDKEEAEKEAKINLLKDVTFNYDVGADNEIAQEEHKRWRDVVDALSMQINESPDDYLSQMQTINKLSNDLQTSRNFGNIKKIEDNYAALKSLRDAAKASSNPATTEMYDRFIQDYYGKVNSRGAYDNPFKQVFYEDEGYTPEEFLNSQQFKDLPETITKKLKLHQGNFIYDDGTKITEKEAERIQKAYKMFLENNPNLKGLFEIKDAFGEEDIHFLDENGNIRYDKDSKLGKNLQDLSIYAYKNAEDEIHWHGDNSFALATHNSKLRREEKLEDLPEGNTNVDRLILENENLSAEQAADVTQTLGLLRGTLSATQYKQLTNGKTFTTYEDLKKALEKSGLYSGNTKKLIANKINDYTEKYTAGWDYALRNGANKAALMRVSADINRNLQTALSAQDLKIKAGKNRYETGGKAYVQTLNTPFGKFDIQIKDGNASNMIGEEFYSKTGEKLKIINVRYKQNSFLPVLNKDAEAYKNWDGKDLRMNDGTFALDYDYEIVTNVKEKNEAGEDTGGYVRISTIDENTKAMTPSLTARVSYDMSRTGTSSGEINR